MKKYDRPFIFWFNKHKTKEIYDDILKDIFIEHKRCIKCNGPVFYSDSTFKFIKSDNTLYPIKRSFLSKKNIFGNEYYLSVCEDCMKEKFYDYSKCNTSRIFNRICDMTLYAFNIPDDVAENWKKGNYSITEENLIKKHGEILGKDKWKNYCDKQAISNTYEYKKEKFGWSKDEFKKYNKSRAVTEKNLIKKHGEILGKEKWNEYCDRQRYTCSKEYFIEQYGDKNGIEKYLNFCDKRSNDKGYSKISQDVFNLLKQKTNYTLLYAENGGEVKYFDSENIRYYLPDCLIKELNIIIEFYGDLWHANPNRYNENDYPVTFDKRYTAKMIWDNDEIRINFLKTIVKDVIIIWESDMNEKGLEKTVDDLILKLKKYE